MHRVWDMHVVWVLLAYAANIYSGVGTENDCIGFREQYIRKSMDML